MKAFTLILVGLAAAAIAAPLMYQSKASVGVVTPSWTLTDSYGKTQSVADFRGKYLVLEWTNKDCPYVRRHYDTGNMQATQAKATAMGAAWLSVISSGPGAQGYMSPSEINSYRKEMKVNSTATVVDAEGKVGHLYGAKATAQIVIIDPKGTIIYNGAIDNNATPDESDNPANATNYALTALKEAMAGKPVTVASTRSYGCGIHYAH